MASLPLNFRKIVVSALSSNFREATKLVNVSMLQPREGELLIKNRYVGINASDVNFSAGRYGPVNQLPIDIGFEGVGEVVARGGGCEHFQIGSAVAFMSGHAFSEYMLLPVKYAILLPEVQPEYVSLLASGLTAAISLEKIGEIKAGENILVTAAAGGTGQFAVQLAKLAGCHVIGTCSSDSKVNFLKSLGCDRPINYKKENLRKVLKEEYPEGIDVVYESVGGEIFETALNRLAIHGRLIVIGFITHYQSPTGFAGIRSSSIPPKILSKSASVRGFFLNNFVSDWIPHGQKLAQLYLSGKIKCLVDLGHRARKGPFKGIESVADAVEYLYTGESEGKVIVDMERSVFSRL